MKIDLHVHAAERSSCSLSCEEAIIEAAIHHGLDGLAFTDHHQLVPPDRLSYLCQKYAPFVVFGGVEVQVEGEDFVVLGVTDPRIEKIDWTYPDFVQFVRGAGGIYWLAHPYRYRDTVCVDVETFVPDAVEVHSSNTGACDEPMICALIEQIGSQGIHTSDAHSVDTIGLYYVELSEPVVRDGHLIECLRSGAYGLGSSRKRIDEFNSRIVQRETVIRRMIANGYDREYYARETGNWAGQFDRVALGKSYQI